MMIPSSQTLIFAFLLFANSCKFALSESFFFANYKSLSRIRGGFIQPSLLVDNGNALQGTKLSAKHPKKKATAGMIDTRPKKHRLSDKIRKVVVYPLIERIPEYTIIENGGKEEGGL